MCSLTGRFIDTAENEYTGFGSSNCIDLSNTRPIVSSSRKRSKTQQESGELLPHPHQSERKKQRKREINAYTTPWAHETCKFITQVIPAAKHCCELLRLHKEDSTCIPEKLKLNRHQFAVCKEAVAFALSTDMIWRALVDFNEDNSLDQIQLTKGKLRGLLVVNRFV